MLPGRAIVFPVSVLSRERSGSLSVRVHPSCLAWTTALALLLGVLCTVHLRELPSLWGPPSGCAQQACPWAPLPPLAPVEATAWTPGLWTGPLVPPLVSVAPRARGRQGLAGWPLPVLLAGCPSPPRGEEAVSPP